MNKHLGVLFGILVVFSFWLYGDVQLNNIIYKVNDFNDQILEDTCLVVSNPNSSNIVLTIKSYSNSDPNTIIDTSTFTLEPYSSEFHTLTETAGFGSAGNFGASGKLPFVLEIPSLFPWPFEGFINIKEAANKPFYAYSYHGNWEYNGPVGGDERIRASQHPEWPEPLRLWYDADISLSYYTTFVQAEGKNCYVLPWVDVWTPCAPAGHPGWDVSFKLYNYSYYYLIPKVKFIWVAGGSGSSAWYDLGLLPPAQNAPWGFRPGELQVSLTSILSQTGYWGPGLTEFCPTQKKFGGIALVGTMSGMMLINNRVFSLD